MPVVMFRSPPPCLAELGALGLAVGQVGILILGIWLEFLKCPLTEDRGLWFWDFSCPTGVSGRFDVIV